MKNNKNYTGLEIAVIGMACRLPGANNLQEFWYNLENGIESIHVFSDDELKTLGVNEAIFSQTNYVKAAGIIKDKDCFDSAFFEYRPEEAALMNPLHRVFHECIWEAIEDAGCNPDTVKNGIGIFAGCGEDLNWKAYSKIRNRQGDIDDFTLSQLNNKDYIASLLSYKLNLKGPSVSINTACSTSLVAINAACKSLLFGDASIILAGGVTIKTEVQRGYVYQEGMINSSDGHCRAFDKEASGTINGEGAGVVVLKRMQDAIDDRDHIYCIIKGSAINNDGKSKVGFTAPSIEGQADCIKRALKFSKVESNSISYVEAHGTGTKLGDPIEIEALNIAFGNNKLHRCAVGSVKTNIGHVDAAAGIAGFIKTALSLKNKRIPPTLHYKQSNPEIDFASGPFYVNTSLTDWISYQGFPLRAGVSSFGIGGTNAHVIMEEAPTIQYQEEGHANKLLLLSAKTEDSLKKYISILIQFLLADKDINLEDMCFTYQTSRKHFNFRKALLFNQKNQLLDILRNDDKEFQIVKNENPNTPVVFMFSGAGSQYINMGWDLYTTDTFFKTILDEALLALNDITGINYKDIIFSESQSDLQIHEMIHTQPVIFVFGYSLAKLLMQYGIEPQEIIGHSIGEYIAACISGIFSFNDALKLVVIRGKLMDKMPAGAMISVFTQRDNADRYTSDKISLAAINGSDQVVYSGDVTAIEKLIYKLTEDDISYVRLNASHAGHSYMIDNIIEEYRVELQSVSMSSPYLTMVSNVTGQVITNEEACSVNYWVKHMRDTVQFSNGLDTLLSDAESKIFIEIGAGHSLVNLLRQKKYSSNKIFVYNIIRHPKEAENDANFFTDKIGKLWEHGVFINWEKYNLHTKRRKISLPTYQFQRFRYPCEVNPFNLLPQITFDDLNEAKNNPSEWFYCVQWNQSPWLPAIAQTMSSDTILIFSKDSFLTNFLINFFSSQNVVCIVVEVGNCFEKMNNQLFRINPASEADYNALFQSLYNHHTIPSRIIHLWQFGNNASQNDEEYDQAESLELGYQSLLNIAKTLFSLSVTKEIQFEMIVSGLFNVLGNEKISPIKSTSIAALKVIEKEFPNVKGRIIDVNNLSDDYLSFLLIELQHFPNNIEVAIRGTNRYIKQYSKIDFSLPKTQNSFKQYGCYLLTGANGAMANIISEFLAENYHAKLVLIGRRKLEDGIIEKLRLKGAKIVFIEAEMDDSKKIIEEIITAEKELGPVIGVIHTAGVVDVGGVIVRRTKQDDYKVFAPKITGTNILYNYFKDRKIDFFLNCSSLAATSAPFGEVAYAAANLYMDFLADARTVPFPIISVEWTAIKEKGAAIKSMQNKSQGEKDFLLKYGLSMSEVISVLEIAIYLKLPIQIISKQNLYASLNNDNDLTAMTEAERNNTKARERPDISSIYKAPVSDIEKKLISMIEKFLGIKTVGIEDNLFELGMDSLKAMVLSKRINKEFLTSLTIKDFFVFPNVKNIAREIEEKKWISSESSKEFVSII